MAGPDRDAAHARDGLRGREEPGVLRQAVPGGAGRLEAQDGAVQALAREGEERPPARVLRDRQELLRLRGLSVRHKELLEAHEAESWIQNKGRGEYFEEN